MSLSPEKKVKNALLITHSASPIREEIKNKIKPLGYDLNINFNIETGWDYFTDALPQLVILDAELNDSDSQDLCSRIKNHPFGRYVIIIVAGTSRSGEDVEIVPVVNANQYIKVSVNVPSSQNWFIEIDQRVNDLADLNQSHKEHQHLQDEIDFMNQQMDSVLTRTNNMLMEAELGYIELNQIFKTTAGGILVIDPDFNILRYNEAFLGLVNLPEEAVEGKKCFEIFFSHLCKTPNCPLKKIAEGHKKYEIELEKQTSGDESVFYMINAQPLKGPDGDLVALVANIFDITERVEAEKAVKKSEERFRLVSEKAPFAQSILNKEGDFEYFNSQFTEVFGYTLNDMPNKQQWMEIAYPDNDYRQEVADILDRRMIDNQENGNDSLIFTVTCKNGREKIIDFKEVEIGNNRKIITYMDITDQRRAQEILQQSEKRYKELSLVDDLTGLFNKRHFNQEIASTMKRADRYRHDLSILLLDIDDFKQYNDTYGHTQGDHLLAQFGEVIHKSIRGADAAFRYGGEEFIVLLPETCGEEAVKVADRIRKDFSKMAFHPTPEESIYKTVSIGVAEYLEQDDARSLIERADKNMYQAKKAGKNRVSF